MASADFLAIACGALVGVSLGLTGGGGSIFAIPLLIYALGAGVREAVGVSLAVVGATSLFGALLRLPARELEMRAGLLFAAAGMIAAPAGIAIGARLPDALTLGAFALLMIVVAARMWRGANGSLQNATPCARTDGDRLHLTGKCILVLSGAGLLAGILSGIFGVGGGFIIVPALVLVTGMSTHRAVTTSLLVIAMICASGVASYYLAGDGLPARLTTTFLGGGFLGMFLGLALRTRLSGSALNRVFAAAMLLVAGFVLARTLLA